MTPQEELREAAQNYLSATTAEQAAWQKQSDATKEWQLTQACTKNSLSRLESLVGKGASRMVRINGGQVAVVRHRDSYDDIVVDLYSEDGEPLR